MPFTLQKKCQHCLIWLVLLLLSSVSKAENVTHTINGILVNADFRSGDSGTAVLITHGFLTTNKFHTVQSMISGLNDEGHTTLAPNLSFNIPNRQQSIKCNSIHTHTLEQDVAEVDAWIKWLEEKGYSKIVLLGHSSGSQELLLSQANNPHPKVKLAIFTSLFYLNGADIGTKQSEIDKAERLAKQGGQPAKYSFLFCQNNYLATPESFLSYHQLTRQKNLSLLNQLTIPSVTIMGSADKRYQKTGENWLEELKATKTKVRIVEGANHFFSSEHEFDLQEILIETIAQQLNEA